MSQVAVILVTGAVTFAAIAGCAVYAGRHGNDLSLIDGYYGMASVVHATLTLALWGDPTARGVLLTLVCGAWSIGLGLHMGLRWWRRERHHGGDVRYQQTAEKIGLGRDKAGSMRFYRLRTFVVVAFPQVLLIVVLNLPMQLAIMIERPALTAWDVVGLVVVVYGGYVEVASNRQLERFKAVRRPGQTLMTGWFAWSRHPNYFGNTLVYVGCFLVAMSDPSLWWTVVSPLTILLTLRFVLGVRMTDQLMLEKRRDDVAYLRYVAETPAFVTVPPALRLRSAQRSIDRTGL